MVRGDYIDNGSGEIAEGEKPRDHTSIIDPYVPIN